MNYKMVFNTVGTLLRVEAALMLLPLAVSFYYKENLSWVYGVVMAILLAVSFIMRAPKLETRRIYAREGFVIVALSWVLLSFFGSLPFVISGAIPSMIDAFFETVSGFTTTGSTILVQIDALPKSILFWRSFTHWVGGMGVLVFVLAIVPQKDMQTMHVMRAEVPGLKVDKLVSKTMITARILYLIYAAMTILLIFVLCLAGMPLFDSVTNAFSTAGTGGFCIHNESIAYYNSAAIEIILSIGMLAFGINFNIYYLILMKQFKRAFKSEELWTYLGIIAVSIVAITLNLLPLVENVGESFRQAGFQVASIVTTTGFLTADFSQWPAFSQMIIVILMMVGSCTGSTAGGLKVGRAVILFKTVVREIRRAINPKRVKCIKFDGSVLDKESISATGTYFALYAMIALVSFVLISLNGYDLTTAVVSVLACFNNVGPSFGDTAAVNDFSNFSNLSKIILSVDMLLGRLEIYPILILFMPSTWKKSI